LSVVSDQESKKSKSSAKLKVGSTAPQARKGNAKSAIRNPKKSTGSAGVPERKKSKSSKRTKPAANNAITQSRNSAIPLLPLDTPELRYYKRATVKYLEDLPRRYMLAADMLARIEMALDIKPTVLAGNFFPQDPFEMFLNGSLDNKGLCIFIANAINMKGLPRAEWLPRLEAAGVDFAKFYSAFKK